ncbi:MAG: hypothetical protein ACI9V8_001039 [Urechidicola sp.]|jgi:hypothetical protein
MLGVQLEPELEQRLAVLAKRINHSKSFITKEAVRYYIDQLETQAIDVKKPWHVGKPTSKREKPLNMPLWWNGWNHGETIRRNRALESNKLVILCLTESVSIKAVLKKIKNHSPPKKRGNAS